VLVSGEVDLATAPALAHELRNVLGSGCEVVVDLEQVTFMDCSGLRALAGLAEDPKYPVFSVTPGPRQLQRLFQLTKFTQLVPVVPAPDWSSADHAGIGQRATVRVSRLVQRRTRRAWRPA
jgi:anti-anti-sigma factor